MGSISAVANPAGSAHVLSREVLSDVGTRWSHSSCAAGQAKRVQRLVGGPWGAALVDAAWLHDVGYNDGIADTGFHPIDGARWLRRRGWPPEVCRLVAWHSRAGTEAELRGLRGELEAEFLPPPLIAQAAMTWADFTSSPAGECCTVDERVADILRRYPDGSIVYEATMCNLPDVLESTHLMEAKATAVPRGDRA